jgi:hypothetical protein
MGREGEFPTSPLSLCTTCQEPLPFQESSDTRWYYPCQKCLNGKTLEPPQAEGRE